MRITIHKMPPLKCQKNYRIKQVFIDLEEDFIISHQDYTADELKDCNRDSDPDGEWISDLWNYEHRIVHKKFIAGVDLTKLSMSFKVTVLFSGEDSNLLTWYFKRKEDAEILYEIFEIYIRSSAKIVDYPDVDLCNREKK
jgi:hypothetical protein